MTGFHAVCCLLMLTLLSYVLSNPVEPRGCEDVGECKVSFAHFRLENKTARCMLENQQDSSIAIISMTATFREVYNITTGLTRDVKGDTECEEDDTLRSGIHLGPDGNMLAAERFFRYYEELTKVVDIMKLFKVYDDGQHAGEIQHLIDVVEGATCDVKHWIQNEGRVIIRTDEATRQGYIQQGCSEDGCTRTQKDDRLCAILRDIETLMTDIISDLNKEY